jgi:signal transduction histidine kinase
VDDDGPDAITERYYRAQINGQTFRILQIHGARIVDPGDKSGGIRHNVTIEYGSSEKRVWAAILRAVGFYAGSSLLVLAATGLLMTWLLNRGLAPLRELAAGASQVSVTSWTFTAPEQARMTRELAPLVTAIESALSGLQHSFEQQSRFVGDAAHELKTGVAVVKSSLQLLGMRPRTVPEYEAGLARCLADCERMEEIVAQMLTLARLEERSTASFLPAATNIFATLNEVAEKLETMAKGRRIPILIHGDTALFAAIDPEQLQLLATNLLINALQHSPEESSVSVEVEAEAAFAEIRFRDHGEGIAPEDLPRIFERFSRGDPSRSRKTGGTGLGLAICKAIVDRFGGSISIHSEIHQGTLVVVCLPCAKSPSN